MAELVQQNLEEMIDEVQELERVGLFDHDEIMKILNKRKKFEYRLRRRVRTEDDFLTYINYETKLLALIHLRRKENSYTHKQAEIEGAILKRILSMFHIVTRNWPQNPELWLANIKFVETKMRNHSLVSRLYNSMLQKIPNQPNLWVMAAKYELESSQSISSARHILTNGLLLNKQAKSLWHEHFRLELLYLDAMNKYDELKAAGLKTRDIIPRYHLTNIQEVKEGRVALTVYKHAREAIPDDVEFALGFVDIVKLFDWSSDIEDEIFQDLFANFENKPEVWEKKAMRFVDTLNKNSSEESFSQVEKKCTKLLKKLISQNTDSVEVWSCFLNVFWALYNTKLNSNRVASLEEKFDLVEGNGQIDENWMIKWLELLSTHSDIASATSKFRAAVTRFPQSSAIWQMYLLYLTGQKAFDVAECLDVFDKARKALTRVPVDMWSIVIELSITHQSESELIKLFELGVVVADNDIAGVIKEKYLEWNFCIKGIKSARHLYRRLRKTTPTTLEFHLMYIKMEQSQMDVDEERIRKAYRHLLDEYGATSTDAWVAVMNLEKKLGDTGKISVTYTQAVKTLRPDLVEEFISRTVIH